jgi:signal transduction histidine kinase
LKDMGPWAAKNQKLWPIYDKIRTGFDHLDGYLRTFTPLARRLARKRTEITGQAIGEFVIDVFGERLDKENIKVNFTPSFISYSAVGFTSTLYPAFVNLIDNAIFWVTKSTGDKTITLDADKNGFVVKDSGPGIPTIDRENVFEFGFSKRVGGQGMGLYVAKQTLERDEFTITLDEYSPDCGAVFRIHSVQDEES